MMLRGRYKNLLSGETVSGAVSLAPRDVFILAE
jgi:hypothetical protein